MSAMGRERWLARLRHADLGASGSGWIAGTWHG